MGVYDPGALYFDPILTGFSVGFSEQTLYADRLAPETPVNSRSARYRVFDRSNWLIYRSRREPGTVANEIGARKWSEDTFNVQEHSLQSAVYDEEEEYLNSQGGLADVAFGGDAFINPEQDAVEDLTRSILLEKELKVATLFRDTAQYAANHKATLTSGGTGTRWDNYASATPGDVSTAYSNPVANIKAAVQRIYLDTGRWPNTMIIPFDAVGVIENHPRVVARYTYTSVLDPNAWRLMLGLPAGVAEQLNVFVVDSRYNTADNVDLAEAIASFWGTDIWIGIVDPTPGQKTKTFSKTFVWPYNGNTKPTDRWREEGRKSDLVRVSYRYDQKVVSPDAGYLITTAVTAVT